MRRTIRIKIVLLTVLILALAIGSNVLISGFLFQREYSRTLNAEMVAIGQNLKLQLDRLLQLEIPIEELVGFEQQCQDLVEQYSDLSYVLVENLDGIVLFHSTPALHGRPFNEISASSSVFASDDNVAIPVFDSHQNMIATIRIGYPTTLVSQKTRRLLLLSIGIAAILLMIAVVVQLSGLFIWITKPLEYLAHSSTKLAVGDIRSDITLRPSNDEIGMLIKTFNQVFEYFREMAHVATEISQGNISHTLHPRSPHDVLGQAFQQMSLYLKDLALAATAIANGDLHQDIQPKTEQDVLGNAFHSMAVQLDENFKTIETQLIEIQKASAEREQLVAELKERNDTLQVEITGRKHAEEALQKLNEELEQRIEERTVELTRQKYILDTFMENVPDSIYFKDRESRITRANKAHAREFGLSDPAEEIGKTDFDLFSEEQAGPKYEQEQEIIHTGQPLLDQEESKPHGRWALTTKMPLRDEHGDIIGTFGISRDITALKQAQQELHEAKEAAEIANRAKSAFLATMSHEIRTPMNGVIGMTNLLLDTDLTPQQRDFATTIRNSGEALLTIINDILDFSKIEAGKLDLESYPFNLRECVESALDLVSMKTAEKGLNLAYLIDAHVPTAIVGDLTRLRQILLNLLSNAVKFTEQGEIVVNVTSDQSQVASRKSSEPSVSDQYPVSSDQYPECELHFTVRDTGIGIPQDRLDRLFKSFSQVDASTTRKYGGTGLGLAISKRLAELMGGTMWVESEVGTGTTFHFTIRAQATDSSQPAYLSSEQPSLQGKRVLVVDDNETNRKILTIQTASWGMEPVAAVSGAAALDLLQRYAPFDLAILDMQMPEMDGLLLAEAIRRYFSARELPLVMLTSLGHQEHDERLQEFAACLTKPVKPSQLYNTLVTVFTGKPGEKAKSPDLSEEMGFDETLGQRLPLRILLAEDNSINQRLALLTLERLGYRADLAGNGIEVLDALHMNPYDVILMDVQMPEMDGVEATRRIRQEMAADVQPRIIAVTANAMQSDREECLNAGMDDYLSKPFQVHELVEALKKCKPHNRKDAKTQSKDAEDETLRRTEDPGSAALRGGEQAEVQKEDQSTINNQQSTILDPAAIKRLKATLGKRATEMLPVLIDAFLKDAVKLQENAGQALEQGQGQAEEVRRAAHTLKSNAKNFGATALAELCQKLEDQAKVEKLESAKELLTRIETTYEIAKTALQTLRFDEKEKNQ